MSIPKHFSTEGPWRHPGGKLLRAGPQSLTDAELLAIIISSGAPQKPATQIAKELIEKFQSFRGLADQDVKELKKGKKTKNGLDLDVLTQNLLSQLGQDNLATFYKDHFAKVPCYTLDLPKRAESIEIENSLLGWRIKIGKKAIDCSSEAQARYLRVFAEMGWDQVVVPQNDGYLSSIIDQWEDHFKKTQSILEEFTTSILQRKTRDRLVHVVWMKLRELMI